MALGLSGLERILPERPVVAPVLIATDELVGAETAAAAPLDPALMQAGWQVYVEAATRLPRPELLAGPGALGEAISALDTLADQVRDMLRAMPPPANAGAETIQAQAFKLLSEVLQPFLTEWRPRHRRFVAAERAEAKWRRAEECRAALIATRNRCLPIIKTIGREIGAPALPESVTALTSTEDVIPLQLPPPSWRWAFFVMASPSIVLAWVLWRFLPEPERGGQSWLEVGEDDPEAASRPSNRKEPGAHPGEPDQVQQKVREARIGPRKDKIIREDPTSWSWWRAMIYLLRLPTYSLLIVASTLAYFFFSGARAFAMIYFPPHYGLARSIVSALVIVLGVGALAGLLAGGRISRRLLDKGNINARIIVPAIALFLSVPFLAIGIWLSIPWIGIPVLMVGTGLLSAALAPIDAARLDIIHPRLWGRGEAGRMALRAGFEGGAPLLFGAMSVWLGGGTSGLMWTLLIMLIPMLIAGSLVVPGLRTYPRDVATAAASVKATAKKQQS